MPIGFDEIQLEESPAGKIVTLKFREQLRKEDFEEFVPKIEGLMGKGDQIRVLVELQNFQGWSAGALWEDTKFAARHFKDIERLAVVGDKKWERGVTVFVKPFTAATVRYFDTNDAHRARRWVRET